ncbi:MAG: hypothetical protein GY856_34205, partial [bacterium]|nr:hypothetical protein [bacterium]
MNHRARDSWLAARHGALRATVLAGDELRLLARSRRGLIAALIYPVVTLLPLIFFLWLRHRFVVVWPINAADVVSCIGGIHFVELILALVLGHDLLTRGDREGWQDGFATLPVGELTWLFGRLLGRGLFLAMIVILPWLVGIEKGEKGTLFLSGGPGRPLSPWGAWRWPAPRSWWLMVAAGSAKAGEKQCPLLSAVVRCGWSRI